ncbi:MAG: hypothetical protein ABGZ17_20690 [Planctomycetaceae bacterium]
MSGIVGHLMYAILGARAAQSRSLVVAPVIQRNFASYLAGAYLGCDIQTLPAALCVQTGEEVGYGSQIPERSPITGGPVRPWTLTHNDVQYTPADIHRIFYGRSHAVFGWNKRDTKHLVPWDHLPDFVANVVGDVIELFGPGERRLAYVLGWSTHIVGDALIKSVQPGIDLHLLNGKYTPQNRPIQDLVTFHEIGRQELGLNWENHLADLVDTPVEHAQCHYMRVSRARGRLAREFPNAWAPELQDLLLKVMAENRRYQRIRNTRLLKQLALRRRGGQWQCSDELSRRTGGLSYTDMVTLAQRSGFRRALWQMGEAIQQLWQDVINRQALPDNWPTAASPSWSELSNKWLNPTQ